MSATWRARSAIGVARRSVSGDLHTGERDLGDVEHRVEDRAAPGDRLVGVDDEHAGVGHDREPVGPIAVEHVTRRAVQHPAVGVAVAP